MESAGRQGIRASVVNRIGITYSLPERETHTRMLECILHPDWRALKAERIRGFSEDPAPELSRQMLGEEKPELNSPQIIDFVFSFSRIDQRGRSTTAEGLGEQSAYQLSIPHWIFMNAPKLLTDLQVPVEGQSLDRYGSIDTGVQLGHVSGIGHDVFTTGGRMRGPYDQTKTRLVGLIYAKKPDGWQLSYITPEYLDLSRGGRAYGISEYLLFENARANLVTDITSALIPVARG